MKAISKSTKIILALVLTVAVALFTMWAVNKHQNEKMYEEGIAKLFDESMEASYPLLKNTCQMFYMRAILYEKNAKIALSCTFSDEEFKEAFIYLNRLDFQSSDYEIILKGEVLYYNYLSSVPYDRLFAGSELREKESNAFRKIEIARQSLNNCVDIAPDSIIRMCNNVKEMVYSAFRDVERYSKPYQDINAWRDIKPDDMIELQRKHEARKNWPFTFLN